MPLRERGLGQVLLLLLQVSFFLFLKIVGSLSDFIVHFCVQSPNLAQMFPGRHQTDSEGCLSIRLLWGGGSGNYVQLITIAIRRIIRSCFDAYYFRSIDVSCVTTNGFRRDATKFHHWGGGELCQTHIFGFGTVIENIFERELFLVEIPNYLQMFQRGAKKN